MYCAVPADLIVYWKGRLVKLFHDLTLDLGA